LIAGKSLILTILFVEQLLQCSAIGRYATEIQIFIYLYLRASHASSLPLYRLSQADPLGTCIVIHRAMPMIID